MLLVHQTGSVRVGEIVRYTLEYTPAQDLVRPIPTYLHVRIRNTCAIALRAAYLHGPYTLYAACYSSEFDPNGKNDVQGYGEPQFEPMLKAGGSWTAKLRIPDALCAACEEPSLADGAAPGSCTWIIECASQILFSAGAQVHYEVIVGRDEKSVEVGFAGLTGNVKTTPGRLLDHQEGQKDKHSGHIRLSKGIFSKAVSLVVEDTATLWDKPRLPGLQYSEFHEFQPKNAKKVDLSKVEEQEEEADEDNPTETASKPSQGTSGRHQETDKKRKVHLVIITHGLHSNVGSDMLYMKESIDAAAKQARIDARARRNASPDKIHNLPIHDYGRDSPKPPEVEAAQQPATSTAPLSGGQDDVPADDDEEEVVVRGFSKNAVRTERGIQYLGKRLAKYVLGMTYPDQPYLPVKKSLRKTLSRTFTGKEREGLEGHASHRNSSVKYGGEAFPELDRPYKVTSISFIGHSLGGLTQTYAIAYIQKHSPEFFKHIQPINFITLASPMLGLSNENPLYVKFALDFGLVGRTGQDLGLTWRAPTLARSGWAGMIAGIGAERQRAPKRIDPGTKPLLRLLPSGPAHQALKLFRNRTVYSNVVNDGIVPLRTSCLLFLDWRGLGRVEKARRGNGLIGTMAGWGWAELTGTNVTEHRSQWPWHRQAGDESQADESDSDEASLGHSEAVPQPAQDATSADLSNSSPESQKKQNKRASLRISPGGKADSSRGREDNVSPLAGFMSLFSASNSKSPKLDSKVEPKLERSGRKEIKAIKRAQTLKLDIDSGHSSMSPSPEPSRSPAEAAEEAGEVFAPPKTSVFEAAGDLLNPPLPPLEFIIDPRSRPRTIFHDRVYHPDDIPPPPLRRKTTMMIGRKDEPPSAEVASMPVEEKIARAYHRDLSWRKVLVRLSPDAHNNIVVRRMFANAYGWPVIKHLVDTHFADTHAALTADRMEDNTERARPMHESASVFGDEVEGQRQRKSGDVDGDDERQTEKDDHVGELKNKAETVRSLASSSGAAHSLDRQDSVVSSAWTDKLFEGTDEESSDDDRAGDRVIQSYADEQGERTRSGTAVGQIEDFLGSHKRPSSKGKTKEQGQSTATNLTVLAGKVSESPTTLSPVTGLAGSLEDRLNLGAGNEAQNQAKV